MSDFHPTYQAICTSLTARDTDIVEGKMMRSPGLKYKGKVFAFYNEEQMGFRLGKQFDPETVHLQEWEWLSPFKTKPPMKAWYLIPAAHADRWPELAQLALAFTKTVK